MTSFPGSARTIAASVDAVRWPLPLLGALALVAAVWLLALDAVVPVRPFASTPTVGFSAGLESYMLLRRHAEATTAALRVTPEPAEILERGRALGLAIQQVRADVHQGNIFTGQVVTDVRRIIASDLGRRSPEARGVLAEDVAGFVPRVNGLYPHLLPLATFPPLLLAALPSLPEGLEYRFMGGDLIIMDVDARLIVDYLPEVLAP